jgi:hypothetical protein
MAENNQKLSINFEEGIKEFEINNDPNRLLKVNVTDIGIIDRIEKSIKDMQNEASKLADFKLNPDGSPAVDEDEDAKEFEMAAEAVRNVNRIMRKNFDAVFYPGSSNIVFGKANLASTINGKTIYENFMRAFIDTVKPYLESEGEKSNERISTYKEKYEQLRAKRMGKRS